MDPAYAAVHAEEDRGHWWFVGRRRILLAEMARWLPRRRCRVVELGCGSGGMLEDLDRFGSAVGVEADPTLLEAARRRGLDCRAGALPGDIPLAAGEWDAVCLFDVLEHLDDEPAALAACRRLLAPGGLLFIAVPAYGWLWSRHDELLGHRRRYTTSRLRQVVAAAGLRIERVSYFNALLAVPIVAARLLRRLLRRGGHDLSRPPGPVNRLLAAIFSAEAGLLRRVSLPFGISLLLVARRSP
ncbi:MAG TPA: class I SAM-dependent methyltransferase [Methylomirabilota bacterium]|nr:class I SAM-dependent methyltransferase [Methylomirabilota bacterium]